MNEDHGPGGQNLEIAIVWAIVAIPFAYGIYNSVKAALDLFSG